MNEDNNERQIDSDTEIESEIENPEDEITELRNRLERAELLIIKEHNRLIFERAAKKAGIRLDRIDAACKLSGIESSVEEINEESAFKIAGKIVANYPEFSNKRMPLTTDQNVLVDSRKSRAAASGDALMLLKALRMKQ